MGTLTMEVSHDGPDRVLPPIGYLAMVLPPLLRWTAATIPGGNTGHPGPYCHWRQGPRVRAFLLPLPLDQPVASSDHLPHKVRATVAGVAFPAAPQDEGLVDGALEAVAARLGDAVLAAPAPVTIRAQAASCCRRGGTPPVTGRPSG